MIFQEVHVPSLTDQPFLSFLSQTIPRSTPPSSTLIRPILLYSYPDSPRSLFKRPSLPSRSSRPFASSHRATYALSPLPFYPPDSSAGWHALPPIQASQSSQGLPSEIGRIAIQHLNLLVEPVPNTSIRLIHLILTVHARILYQTLASSLNPTSTVPVYRARWLYRHFAFAAGRSPKLEPFGTSIALATTLFLSLPMRRNNL